MNVASRRCKPPRSGRNLAWGHVALVFAFMLVNYADKAVIGLSSVPIMRDLKLTNVQFGEVGSAFFLLFSVSGIAGGFLADRVQTKRLMCGMAVLWGLALLPMIWVSSFGLLIASRILLGVAEGPAFPVALHSVYKWFDDRRRALPTSVVACGAAFGTGVIAPLITWIIVRYGWHAAFGALGLAGIAWACLWVLVATEGSIEGCPGEPEDRGKAPQRAAHVPYRRLFTSRTAIGVFLGGFGAYWVIALNITWLANYLIKVLHLTPSRAAWIVALPSVMQLILAPALAIVSQFLSARGLSSRLSRGALGSACVMAAGLCLIIMARLPMSGLKVVLIGFGCSIGSVIFTLGATLVGEISPIEQRGALLGVTNGIHTVAGLCAPIMMGVIIDAGSGPAAGFRNGYIGAGTLVAALGLLAAILIEPQADLRRFAELSTVSARD